MGSNSVFVRGFVASALALGFALSATAETPQEGPIDVAAEITNLTQQLEPLVQELNRGYFVWHWLKGYERWEEKLDAFDSLGSEYVREKAGYYFASLCPGGYVLPDESSPVSEKLLATLECVGPQKVSGQANLYGPGLYVAPDPALTKSYGGGANFGLIQIYLPEGFRILDLVNLNRDSPELSRTLSRLGCGVTTLRDLMRISSLNPNRPDKTCQLAVRKVLKEALKLDGFVYSYNGVTNFPSCPAATDKASVNGAIVPFDRTGAFVITSFEKLGKDSGSIKVFNLKSDDATVDRRRIQTLIMAARGPVSDDRKIEGSESLVWPDLDGQSVFPAIEGWMKENIYGCSDSVPYYSAPYAID